VYLAGNIPNNYRPSKSSDFTELYANNGDIAGKVFLEHIKILYETPPKSVQVAP